MGVSDSVPILLWERVNSGYQAILSHPCTNYPGQPGYEASMYVVCRCAYVTTYFAKQCEQLSLACPLGAESYGRTV